MGGGGEGRWEDVDEVWDGDAEIGIGAGTKRMKERGGDMVEHLCKKLTLMLGDGEMISEFCLKV